MSQIKVLSKDISELIAAGEVIERPASVIKELIENSIDAGAEHITVEIKKGGTVFMRITDDGCGMEYEDVPTAFLRHATSKISAKDDLDNIMTLGFRGEALASVSAVAKVDVMTKRKFDEFGTHYVTEGSIEKLYEKSGCPDGTTIIIRDLFFNVPVRRNFMKKDVTEGNAVSKIVQKTALSHPEVSFKFIRDGKLEFNSSGDGNIYSAIYAVYGKDFANDMVAVKYSSDGIEIGGFVIKPLYAKSNRTFQNFFVNGRYVKSLICQVALESAYNNLLMTGKFPACILTISVKPSTVDVNIHPSKAEVRFSDEKKISDSVYFAVKNALLDTGLTYEFKLKNTDEVPAEPEKNFGSIFTKPEDIEKAEQKLSEQPAESNNISKIPFRYEENNIDVKRT
ncbi:MAG: DNA mismatch repair endonuclease MutL, partial [Ruminococcus sp.]|nr:DNA mismatch repair endonuclease MutL [Ruminococcus sp.]